MTDEFVGPDNFLDRPKAAILNSRQSKFPVGDDPWIVNTGRAVNFVHQQNFILLCSLGMNTWELTLTQAARSRLPVIIIIACPNNRDKVPFMENLLNRFRLKSTQTGFLFLGQPADHRPKSWWPVRDKRIVELADVLYPISVRPEGNLESLLGNRSRRVDRRFSVPYNRTARRRPRYDNREINPEIWADHLLIHFTRSSFRPWPDETDFDYYSRVTASHENFCQSASAALGHILEKGVIYGSREKIRGNFTVVGFSAVTPENIQRLFRYRPRVQNPGFEPFGIALTIEYAAQLGLRPVQYGPSALYEKQNMEDRPFFQNEGRDRAGWRVENEWRLLGNFEFNRLPADKIRVIVPGKQDMDNIERYTSLEIIPMYAD